MPYCGIASGVLSILIVRADRRRVNPVGSGSPVNGATLVRFSGGVVIGRVVVVDEVPRDVVVVDEVPRDVVVVESAGALDAPSVATLKLTIITSPMTRRIRATYLAYVAQSRRDQKR
jgi:hypothetical protein